jgi:hypothetical protein
VGFALFSGGLALSSSYSISTSTSSVAFLEDTDSTEDEEEHLPPPAPLLKPKIPLLATIQNHLTRRLYPYEELPTPTPLPTAPVEEGSKDEGEPNQQQKEQDDEQQPKQRLPSPCDEMNSIFYKTLGLTSRRIACDDIKECVFEGRSFEGRCWEKGELAVEEGERVKRKEKREAERIEERRRRVAEGEDDDDYDDDDDDDDQYSDNNYNPTMNIYGLSEATRPGDLNPLKYHQVELIMLKKGVAAYSNLLHTNAKAPNQLINFQQSSNDENDIEKEGGLKDVRMRALTEEIGRDITKDLQRSIASKTAENLKRREGETKRIAVELVQKTLTDPTVPKKAGEFVTGLLGRPGVAEAAANSLRDGVLTKPWLATNLEWLTKEQLRYWMVVDDDEKNVDACLTLRKSLIELAEGIIPQPWVHDIVKTSALLPILDPESDVLKKPLANLVAGALPGLTPVAQETLGENIHWVLKDTWWRDYAKAAVLEELRRQMRENSGVKEEEGGGEQPPA